MVRIWAYTVLKERDKITKQIMYDVPQKFAAGKLFVYLCEICSKLDIPVPVVLEKHTNGFAEFNHTKFDRSDFVESVGFNFLALELVFEK